MTSAPCPVHGYLQQPSMVDFPGRFAAVFVTSGCNFTCGFCHNPALTTIRKCLSWDDVSGALGRFKGQWVNGVVVSGGEPTVSPGLIDLLRVIKQSGLHIKLDTNGSRPDTLAEALRYVDYVAMDIKCSLPRYPDFVGFNDEECLTQSIDLIKREAGRYEFRTTVIPSIHTDTEMLCIADTVQGAQRFVLQPFVPREDLPDPALRREPRTTAERLTFLAELMQPCAEEILIRGV